LFISYQTFNRLSRNGAYQAVVKYAKKLGFHNSDSPRLEDHFGPHCFRHWFTTWLLRNGMPREYVKELRGDRRKEAIDIYHHIDQEDLRKAYLACIPKLGI
jgi:integrase/recombinase XerD